MVVKGILAGDAVQQSPHGDLAQVIQFGEDSGMMATYDGLLGAKLGRRAQDPSHLAVQRRFHAVVCFGAALFNNASCVGQATVRRVNDMVDSSEEAKGHGLEELEVLAAQVDEMLEVSMAELHELEAAAYFAGHATIAAVCDGVDELQA
jgi:hypothetical protein